MNEPAHYNFKLVVFLFLVLVIAVLILQAFNIAWRYHLRVDIDGQYVSNARHFLKFHNLNSLGHNEYQPGAVLFFLALSPALLIQDSADYFLLALFASNIFLIAVFAVIYKKISGLLGLFTFSLLILFTGPIVLYRFDLFTFLFILVAILFWRKNKFNYSLFFLGVATAIKIFPALLAPYFLIISAKNKLGITTILKQIVSYVAGLLSIISIYLVVFGGRLSEIMSSLEIHARKPVHVESVWGSILTIYSKLTSGQYALGAGDVGIFGIAREYTIGLLTFYNYFWIVAIGLLYLWLFLKLRSMVKINYQICSMIVLLFLVFSKILTPQYLLWFMLFFPLLSFLTGESERRNWFVNLLLILLASFLSQYIYPLRYNELLAGFYTNGSFSNLFWLLTLRNLILIILAFKFIKEIKWNPS